MFALEQIQWDTLALNGPATKYQEQSLSQAQLQIRLEMVDSLTAGLRRLS